MYVTKTLYCLTGTFLFAYFLIFHKKFGAHVFFINCFWHFSRKQWSILSPITPRLFFLFSLLIELFSLLPIIAILFHNSFLFTFRRTFHQNLSRSSQLYHCFCCFADFPEIQSVILKHCSHYNRFFDQQIRFMLISGQFMFSYELEIRKKMVFMAYMTRYEWSLVKVFFYLRVVFHSTWTPDDLQQKTAVQNVLFCKRSLILLQEGTVETIMLNFTAL